jgi:hypothetical protein
MATKNNFQLPSSDIQVNADYIAVKVPDRKNNNIAYNFPLYQAKSVDASSYFVYSFAPRTALSASNTLANSTNYIDFELSGFNENDLYHSATLTFTLQNNNGSNAATLCSMPAILRSVIVQNNGEVFVKTGTVSQFAQHIITDVDSFNKTQLIADLNYSTTYANSATTIAAGASREYRVSVLNPWHDSYIPLNRTLAKNSGALLYRFYLEAQLAQISKLQMQLLRFTHVESLQLRLIKL